MRDKFFASLILFYDYFGSQQSFFLLVGRVRAPRRISEQNNERTGNERDVRSLFGDLFGERGGEYFEYFELEN